MTTTYRLGDLDVNRVGFGAMQLAGPGVFGPPKDRDEALAVLRTAVELGIDHIAETLHTVAERLDATPMAVALAWLLQRSPNMLLIPGTSAVAHLRENVAGAALELPPDAVKELDAIGG